MRSSRAAAVPATERIPVARYYLRLAERGQIVNAVCLAEFTDRNGDRFLRLHYENERRPRDKRAAELAGNILDISNEPFPAEARF